MARSPRDAANRRRPRCQPPTPAPATWTFAGRRNSHCGGCHSAPPPKGWPLGACRCDRSGVVSIRSDSDGLWDAERAPANSPGGGSSVNTARDVAGSEPGRGSCRAAGGGSPRRELPSPPGQWQAAPAPRRFLELCRVPGTEAGLVLPVCSGPQEAFASDPQGASGATWSDGCKAGSQGRWVGEEAGGVPSQSRRLQGELRCGLGDAPARAGAEDLFENKQTPVFLGTISKRTQI